MVIITGPVRRDDETPPRSIFDPPNVSEAEELSDDGWGNTTTASSLADTLTTRDTLSTGISSSPNRRRHHRKHPSQLNEVELRIQLWDSYRLARIILGTPIKSSSLRGKTILHSIRKVAEMKLELIRLQKELEMEKVIRDSEQQFKQSNNSAVDSSEEATVRTSSSKNNLRTSLLLSDELNFQIANILAPEKQSSSEGAEGTPMKSNRRHATSSDYDDDNIPTPPHKNKAFTLEQRLDLYKVRYETLQATHDEMMQEFQTQLLEMQAHLQLAESSPPENSEKKADSTNTAPQTATGESSASTPITSSRKAAHKTPTSSRVVTPITTPPSGKGRAPHPQDPAGSTSKTRGWGLGSSSKKQPKAPISRAGDAMDAVVAVARDHDVGQQTPEELHLRTVLAKKSNAVRPKKVTLGAAATTTGYDAGAFSQERQKLQEMVEQLMQRVEQSSEETKAHFDSLQEKLRSYQRNEALQKADISVEEESSSIPTFLTTHFSDKPPEIQNQQQFQRRLQTAKTLHTLELETAKSKHVQQVVDLSGQLDAYQHQVDRQNSELKKWSRKFYHLEEMAVTPSEAKDVLRELEGLSPLATREEHERVQTKVVRVLQRMVLLQTRQQKERHIMDMTRRLAQGRTEGTQTQLEDLKLQLEILQEDTQIPPEEWQNQISNQRKIFEKEIKDIFRQEERRMVEMENLEVQLTELAFVAVEIEDLEQECHDNKEIYADALSKARQELASTSPLIERLQSQIKRILDRQRTTLEDLELSWSKGVVIEKWQGRLAELCRANNPHEQLQQREEELCQTQTQLAASQRRVRELEAQMEKLR